MRIGLLIWFFVLAGLAPVSIAIAQSRASWQVQPGVTSAAMSTSGWNLVSSTGLSWPDGSQAVVTFWLGSKDFAIMWGRCIERFDRSMVSTNEVCHLALQPEAQQK